MAASQAQSPDNLTELSLAGHQGMITCMAWLPDEQIVTGSLDHTMRIWNCTTGEQEGTPMLHRGQPMGIVTTKDGRIISCSNQDTRLMVWNAATQELLHHTSANEKYGIPRRIALSPNEDLLVSFHTGWIVFWEVAETIQVRNHIDPQHTKSLGHFSPKLSFSRDGKRLATCHDEVEVNIFDVESGERIFGPFRDKEYLNGVRAIIWSPNGGRLFCAWVDGSIRHLDPCTGETMGEVLLGQLGHESALDFSPDGKWLAGRSDTTLRLWDTESGDPVGKPVHPGSDFRLNAFGFSRSGGRVAWCGDNIGSADWRLLILPVLDASTDNQQVLRSLLDQPAVVSPDGPSSNAREIDFDFLDISAPRRHLPPQHGSRANPPDERPRMRSSTVSWKWWKRIPRLVLDRSYPVYMGRAEPRTHVASRHTADSSTSSEQTSTPASSEDDPNATMMEESDSGESNEESAADTPPDDIEVSQAGCCGLLSRRRAHATQQRQDVPAQRSAHPTRPPNSADTATPVPPSTRPAVQDILALSAVV